MSHDGMDRPTELPAIDNWYSKQVAYLLGKLDAVNEGTGTLLDNTLVVWGRELGNTSHNMEPRAHVMAGKAGGAMRTGRFLNYDGKEHAQAAGLDRPADGHDDDHQGGQPTDQHRAAGGTRRLACGAERQ